MPEVLTPQPEPEKILDQKTRLFERIAEIPNTNQEDDDRSQLIRRVLEHSLEDGLELMQTLGITDPKEISKLLFDDIIANKHNKFFKEFLKEIFDNMTLFNKSSSNLMGQIVMWHVDYGRGFMNRSQPLPEITDPKAESILKDLDAYYANLLKHRSLKPKEFASNPLPEPSPGTKLALDAIEENALTLSPKIKTGDFLSYIWDLLYHERREMKMWEGMIRNPPLKKNFLKNYSVYRFHFLRSIYHSIDIKSKTNFEKTFSDIYKTEFLTPLDARALLYPLFSNVHLRKAFTDNQEVFTNAEAIIEAVENKLEKLQYKPWKVTYETKFKLAEKTLKKEILEEVEKNGTQKEKYEITLNPETEQYEITEKQSDQDPKLPEDPEDPEFWNLKKWKKQAIDDSTAFMMNMIPNNKRVILQNDSLYFQVYKKNRELETVGPGIKIKSPEGFHIALTTPGIKIIDNRPCFVAVNKNNHYIAYFGEKSVKFDSDDLLMDFTFLKGKFVPVYARNSDGSLYISCQEGKNIDLMNKNDMSTSPSNYVFNIKDQLYILKKDGVYSVADKKRVTGSFDIIDHVTYIGGNFVVTGTKNNQYGIFINDIMVSNSINPDHADHVVNYCEKPAWVEIGHEDVVLKLDGQPIGSYKLNKGEYIRSFGIINGKAIFEIHKMSEKAPFPILSTLISGSNHCQIKNLQNFSIRSMLFDNYSFTLGVDEDEGGKTIMNLYTRHFGPKPKFKNLSDQGVKLLNTLNLLHSKDRQEIGKFLFDHQNRSNIDAKTKSHPIDSLLKSMINKAPEIFIDQLAAKSDPPGLAKKVFQQLFPETVRQEKSDESPDKILESPAGGITRKVQKEIDHALRETIKFPEGDPIDTGIEVMTLREPGDSFLVTGAYTSFDSETKEWRKCTLPMAPYLQEPCAVQTIVLHNVPQESTQVLPTPMNAEILPDRIKGLTSDDQEIRLTGKQTPVGETTITLPPEQNTKEVIYSLRQSLLPDTLEPITHQEYENFKRKFSNQERGELTAPLFRLPPECKAFLAAIADHGSRQKVMDIETFVRQIAYYDFDNKEISKAKSNVNLDERFAIMKQRLKDIRNDKPDLRKDLANKLFAGVCLDDNILLIAMLREAGFMAGLLNGYKPDTDKKKVTTERAHAISFIIWPLADEGNKHFYRLVTVDGTPKGVNPDEQRQLSNIQSPSLVDKEELKEKMMEQLEEKETETLGELTKELKELAPEALKKLENGKLEKMLNKTSLYAVKPENVSHLNDLLNFWRYSGKMPTFYSELLDIEEVKTELRDLLKEHYRTEPTPNRENLEKYQRRVGDAMMQLMLDFIRRLEADPLVHDRKHAIESLQSMIDLSRDFMEPIEYQAATLILTYLNTGRMR